MGVRGIHGIIYVNIYCTVNKSSIWILLSPLPHGRPALTVKETHCIFKSSMGKYSEYKKCVFPKRYLTVKRRQRLKCSLL